LELNQFQIQTCCNLQGRRRSPVRVSRQQAGGRQQADWLRKEPPAAPPRSAQRRGRGYAATERRSRSVEAGEWRRSGGPVSVGCRLGAASAAPVRTGGAAGCGASPAPARLASFTTTQGASKRAPSGSLSPLPYSWPGLPVLDCLMG